jgi:hypothetical protein
MVHLLKQKCAPLTLESTHFIFNKCSIYTHEGTSAKFSANYNETGYSVLIFSFSEENVLSNENTP